MTGIGYRAALLSTKYQTAKGIISEFEIDRTIQLYLT